VKTDEQDALGGKRKGLNIKHEIVSAF